MTNRKIYNHLGHCPAGIYFIFIVKYTKLNSGLLAYFQNTFKQTKPIVPQTNPVRGDLNISLRIF